MCTGDSVCMPAGNTVEGSFCQITLDCADGLYCGARNECAQGGTVIEGNTCDSTADCEAGLTCQLVGLVAVCAQAGSVDIGQPCGGPNDCLAGLTCLQETDGGTCIQTPRAGLDDPPPPPAVGVFTGVSCDADPGAVRAYFRVPRGNSDDGDFYRLPFPNDARRTATGLDLSGHPTPATALEIDAIDLYLRGAEQDLDGFATNPVAYFRFSSPYDWDTTGGNFYLIDVDPDSPNNGDVIPASWLNTFGPISKYICPDWLGIRTLHGFPLRPGNTYAVVLTNGIRASDGTTYARDSDFSAMMSSERPNDGVLGPVWDAYQPLRDHLAASTMLDSADVLNATVFTTQSEPEMASFRDAVRAEATPTVSDLTLCGDGVTSPCEDAEGRGACSAPNAAFHEIHGRISLPNFQQGTAPYLRSTDGGNIAYDTSGAPVVQGTTDVCFALTIPAAATMPVDGWPVLLAGHGTGGSFLTAIDGGRAAEVVDASIGADTVNAATIAIDFPSHGSRRGASELSPDVLFFNVANPRAARDNILQGSADLMSVLYYLEGADIDQGTSPTGDPISFDLTRSAMYMHSQGATHAALMIADEPLASNVVLSGVGGDLTQSLLNKTEPIDIAGLIPVALLDFSVDQFGEVGPLPAGDFHPALAMFQMFFEAADPVNVAARLRNRLAQGQTATNVFMTYGVDDNFTPPATMAAYVLAAGIPLVNPVLVPISVGNLDAPVSNNFTVNATPATLAVRQYMAPAGVDGHFVASQSTDGRADTRRFLLQALAGQTVAIGE